MPSSRATSSPEMCAQVSPNPPPQDGSVHTSQIAARIPSPACWGRWRHRASKDARLSTGYGAGWGVARRCDASRIARPSPRTFVGPYLLSAPHPAFGHLPRFAEKGKPATASSPMKSITNSTCANAAALARRLGWAEEHDGGTATPHPAAPSARPPSPPRALAIPRAERSPGVAGEVRFVNRLFRFTA